MSQSALHHGNDTSISGLTSPVHLHLREQDGVYALYCTPLPASLCGRFLRPYLQAGYLLIVRLATRSLLARPDLTPAQWLRLQGLQAHSIPPSYALVPARYLEDLVNLSPLNLLVLDTARSPDEVAQVDIAPMEVDTFACVSWRTLFPDAVGNRFCCELREERTAHLLSLERPILADLLSRFLREYIQTLQPGVPMMGDFPSLVHEQLWQYAAQGFAPLRVQDTEHGVEMSVALGTPDHSLCVMAQSCQHMSQIQRGFVLRWHGGTWDLCSTEEMPFEESSGSEQ